MEIHQDLLRIEKSNFRIILGVLSLILAITFFMIEMIDNGSMSTFYFIYFLFFFLNGIVNIIEGKGISSSKFFGKAYILINKEKVLIKKSILNKEKSVYWNEIESIRLASNNFVFETFNKELLTIKLSEFNYSLIQKIKETVGNIAKENNIEIYK